VLVEPDGTVAGRINLVDVENGSANLGYRIAERATGRGLATHAVHQVCEIAAGEYGLVELRAAATRDNAASQAVLARTGFVYVGDTTLNGRPALRYLRRLAH
jgi:ribosomal-protein-alanine N-acetyltransferase